jgi:phosphoribosylaminoimidazolecarboxamide formyltransferase / IMP cyclohydrolase
VKKRALISLYDKTGLVNFARSLVHLGWELVASGGTAQTIHLANLPVCEVADITGSPEILGGRVKTLHPAIHGGILAQDTARDKTDLAAQKIEMIDLVVCNLYPFQETVNRPDVTLNEAVEQIDIGGVTLLRAAAKNFARVTVICDPSDYEWVLNGLEEGTLDMGKRQELAIKAFNHTRDYDTAIVKYLEDLI